MKNSRISRRQGFTLIELLVVIVIIVTLMAILIPVVGSVRRKAVKLQAKNTLTTLVTSVDTYYSTYNILPSNTRSAPSEDTEVQTTEPIMSVLAGINIDDMNKKEQVFFDGEQAKGSSKNNAFNGLWLTKTSAELYDPWRKPPGKIRGYILLLDYGYDGRLDDPFKNGKVIARRAVAWSTGKDGQWNRGSAKTGANKDNVYSWF
ncbi:type II secretion system protein [Roseibacillus ishigakijimensis]|uniref:Type II secretion system protein n=1 Tax=Roseibacillus ishigakijimensis TaxID=454146 RepID=A0A934VM50_9BACT|nr:type II secretion system protein [Roseibacillus ishigakijimensis]MBK1833731.1 type II secretion system protein [Roseibacillus ishigakijimensis]